MTLGSDEVQRSLGRLEGRVDGMQEALEIIGADVKKMSRQISEARGGWKVVLGMCGLSGAVGAAVVKLLPFLAVVR